MEPSTKKNRILVVDDEKGLVKLIPAQPGAGRI